MSAQRFLASRISSLPDRRPLLLIFLVFGLVVLAVDPLRETPMEDDWAYAWTVWHLLETGRYELHAWLSANMPFQAWWGALAATLAGFSFGVLRVSTLALSGIGLVAFYLLALEHRLARKTACLLTLILWSSPLYLRFSFNFMTDVPFASLFVLALLLYTRALRRESYPLMIAGALAATACILTRQFGVALIAGLVVSWLLRDRRWQRLPFLLAGSVLPAVATLWQIYMGLFFPNWGARYSTHLQADYLSHVELVLLNFAARPSLVAQYMALFCLPLLPVAGLAFREAWRGADRGTPLRREAALLGVASVFVLVGSSCHYAAYGQALMPLLPWNFGGLLGLGTLIRVAVTGIVASGAILFARLFLLRYLAAGWSRLGHEERLLDLATLFSLALTLVFLQIGDEYLLVYLPYTLIVVGLGLERWIQRATPLVAGATALVLLGSVLWTRSLLGPPEIVWRACEEAVRRGVPTERIWGNLMWASYHHFDDYAAHVDPTRIATLEPSFRHWLRERQRRADYFVILGKAELERTRHRLEREGVGLHRLAEYSTRVLPGLPETRAYLVRRVGPPSG